MQSFTGIMLEKISESFCILLLPTLSNALWFLYDKFFIQLLICFVFVVQHCIAQSLEYYLVYFCISGQAKLYLPKLLSYSGNWLKSEQKVYGSNLLTVW